MMRRKPDWFHRLSKAIEARASKRFRWGSHDCCTGACALAKAQTGVDPMKALRGYRSEREALKTLVKWAPKRTAKDRLLEAVAVRLAKENGLPEVPPLRAQRGFIVLAEGETPSGRADVLGVVDLSGRHVLAPGPEGGWSKLPLKSIKRAWDIS